MNIFHRISLSKVDPLGGGLREEIAAEQLEPEAFTLEDGIIEGKLEADWEKMENELKKDPMYYSIDE